MAKRKRNIFYGSKNSPGQLSESIDPDDGNLRYQDRSMQAFAMERRSVPELPHRPRRAGGDSCRSQRVVAVTGGGDGGHARAYRTCNPSNRRDGRRSRTAPGSRPLHLCFWAAVALHGLPSSAGSVLCSRDAGTRSLTEHSPTQFKRQPLYRWEA